MGDDHLRGACFASLDVLSAEYGLDIPYKDGLDRGFPFAGHRVPFLSPQKGIFRAAVQKGASALSINTSWNTPYDDEEASNGFFYAYRAGSIDQPDNRALRSARASQAPLVYFVATAPGRYKPIYPCFITEDDERARRVLVTPGRMVGPIDEPEPVLSGDILERKYAVRETRVRLHQARFRGHVLVAYSSLCAICRLKESRLLDAAHITADLELRGDPVVANGLSLCSIHHRAFDQNLVGVSPDYEVHVSKHLLDDEDGPMLELLKGFHKQPIVVPSRRAWKPDRNRLGERFRHFVASSI